MHIPEAAIAVDISTMFVIATYLCVLLGLFLLAVWREERSRALAWWGVSYLIGGCAAALWSLDGWEASRLAPALPGALLFLACGMIWSAARLFHGRPVLGIAMSAGALAWALAYSFPSFAQASAQRVVLSSLIISAYTFLTALELWRERRKTLIRRWPALFVPLLHAAIFLVPIPLASLLPDERGVVTLASGWLAIFALEALLYVIGMAFIVLVLSKERAVRLHKTAAMTDPLTGLFNRRAFYEGARQLMAAQARRHEPVAVLLFDLDHFKSINDRFGHAVGDHVLKLFATTLRANTRATDLAVRLGGEEFAALIPGASADAVIGAERVRLAFANAGLKVRGQQVRATVSVGAAAGDPTGDIDALLARADAALYRAKAEGRDRVESAAPVGPAETVSRPQEAGLDRAEATIRWIACARGRRAKAA